MTEYFPHSAADHHHGAYPGHPETAVLTEEDEAFLHRLTSEVDPPPLPDRPRDLAIAGETRGNDAQIALMNGAQNIPLPDVPDTPEGPPATGDHHRRYHHDAGKGKEKEIEKEKTKGNKRATIWSFLRRDSRDGKRKANAKDKDVAAADLHSVAEGLKSPHAHVNEDGIVTSHEAKNEEDEMTDVLEQLNLAAINNRVFSISKESQELLRKYVTCRPPLFPSPCFSPYVP